MKRRAMRYPHKGTARGWNPEPRGGVALDKKTTGKKPSTRVPFTAEERAAFDAQVVREAGPRLEAEERIRVLVRLLGTAEEAIELGRNESFWIQKVAKLWLAAWGGQSPEKHERAIIMGWIQRGADLEARRAWFRGLPPEVQHDVRRHGVPATEATKAVWPWRELAGIASTGLPVHALWGEESPAAFVQRAIAKSLVMRMLDAEKPAARAQIEQLLVVWKKRRGNGPVKDKALGKWELLAALFKTLRFSPVGVEALKSEWTKGRSKKSSG